MDSGGNQIDEVVAAGKAAVDQAAELFTVYGLRVVGGFLILAIGWLLASWLSRGLGRLLARSRHVDPMLRGFFTSLLRYAILAFVVIAVLNQFGVETASLIALFGAAGLAIGLALQGTLSNLAAGVMLLLFRPFRIGQSIQVAGQTGTVRELTLFYTELVTGDNVQIIIPNGAVWGSSVINYSFHATRRLELTLPIALDSDIEQAKAILRQVVAAEPRVLPDPPPEVVVGALSDAGITLIVRAWTKSADLGGVTADFIQRFKQGFDAAGIAMPRRELRLVQPPAT